MAQDSSASAPAASSPASSASAAEATASAPQRIEVTGKREPATGPQALQSQSFKDFCKEQTDDPTCSVQSIQNGVIAKRAEAWQKTQADMCKTMQEKGISMDEMLKKAGLIPGSKLDCSAADSSKLQSPSASPAASAPGRAASVAP